MLVGNTSRALSVISASSATCYISTRYLTTHYKQTIATLLCNIVRSPFPPCAVCPYPFFSIHSSRRMASGVFAVNSEDVPAAIGPYSHAVKHSDVIYTSGQIGELHNILKSQSDIA